MKKDKRYLFLKRLLEEKEKITDIIYKMKNDEELGSMDKYYTELSFYDNHPADLGTEMFMMEHDKGLLNKLNDALYEIETSIEELESNKYGLCSICGEKINEERLELIPYTKLCIDCSKKKAPLDEKMDYRPEEEDGISPFSKGYDEGNEFDREDSYQEVARFNRIANDPSFATGDDMGVLDEEGSGVVEEVERISQDYYDETNKES